VTLFRDLLTRVTRAQLSWQSSLATMPAAYIIYRACRLEGGTAKAVGSSEEQM